MYYDLVSRSFRSYNNSERLWQSKNRKITDKNPLIIIFIPMDSLYPTNWKHVAPTIGPIMAEQHYTSEVARSS